MNVIQQNKRMNDKNHTTTLMQNNIRQHSTSIYDQNT